MFSVVIDKWSSRSIFRLSKILTIIVVTVAQYTAPVGVTSYPLKHYCSIYTDSLYLYALPSELLL